MRRARPLTTRPPATALTTGLTMVRSKPLSKPLTMALTMALTVALTSALPRGAHAQQQETMLSASTRSLEELIAQLPGRPVRLADLLTTARARNLDLEASRAAERMADAGAGVARELSIRR